MDLHGSCGCGRNSYVIEIPATSRQVGRIFFDNSSSNRRHLVSPFTAWLQVPLSWFYSATFSFFPDEDRRSISKAFVSPFDPHTRRQFCGYCGTQLTLWNDGIEGDENFINVTLGSLFDEDLESLEDLGLLQLDSAAESEVAPQQSQIAITPPVQRPSHRGAPWFESMIEESHLGKLKRQKGGHTSHDGSVSVEWEVVEWTGSSEEPNNTGKRKIGEVEESDDAPMQM